MTVTAAPQEQSLRSLLKGNVLVLTLSRILWSMSDALVLPYLSLYILELGGDKPTIGWVNAVGSLAACLLYPIGGYIADKAGRAKFVGVSTLLYVSSFLIFAFSPNWRWIALAVAYQNIVLFYMPALNAIMADSIPVGTRGKLYALTIAIPNAVRIFTPYIGGLLIDRMTLVPAMRLGYKFSFGMGLVVSFLRLRYLKETVPDAEGIGRDVVKILVEGYRNAFNSIRWTFSNLKGYALVSMLMAFIGSIVLPFWIVYANEVIGLSEYQWGVIMLAAGVAKTVLSFYIGGIVDRIGSRKCFLITFLLAVPGMYLFTLVTSFWAAMAIYIMLVVSSAFMWIASSVYLADSIPREMRGRVMAGLGSGMSTGVVGGGYASGFLVFIPMTVGNILGGYIYEYSPALPWILQSVFLALGLILTWSWLRNPDEAQV
ncbi:MFS transporter [Candidatus Bathyarchaeota archaeon]|nr:MFS transporter [Candidatus Bathyarchaeota archaeon]